MVFVHFSGVKVNSIAYAVTAIVLLPINSALNPILYSSFIDQVWQKLDFAKEQKVKTVSGTPTRSTNIGQAKSEM